VDVLAEWLSWNLSREELAAEAEQLFCERGPALPRQMRLDLRCFLEDRSAKALAQCLAMNEEPSRRREFVDWCAEIAAEGEDPYARLGLRHEDFCAERGPGRVE
jgi:hypothetical protein